MQSRGKIRSPFPQGNSDVSNRSSENILDGFDAAVFKYFGDDAVLDFGEFGLVDKEGYEPAAVLEISCQCVLYDVTV